MNRIKSIFLWIWNDPVISNLIANVITAFIAWLFYKTTISKSEFPIHPGDKEFLFTKIPQGFCFFQTNRGRIAADIIYAALILVFLLSFYRALIGFVWKLKSSHPDNTKNKMANW